MYAQAEIPAEAERVETWRLHVLIRAGYPTELAEQIAHSDADLHQAVDILRNGCTTQTAAEILI